MEQISLLDIIAKEDKEKLVPEMWDCMETCANFTDVLPGGGRDRFPVTGERRCCIEFHKGDGTTGRHMKCKIIDNVWHTWCIYYKPKIERRKKWK